MGIVSALSALLGVILYAAIGNRIRTRHQDLWIKLGRPGALYDPRIDGSHHLASYIWTWSWIRFGDRILVILCIAFHIAVGAMVLSFIVSVSQK